MMVKHRILTLCISVLIAVGCQSSSHNDEEAQWQAKKDSVGVTLNITKALQEWRKDSLACTNTSIRIQLMDQGLFKVVELQDLPYEQMIKLLGNPNRSRKTRGWVKSRNREEEVFECMYYTTSDCYNEHGEQKADPVSWISVKISEKDKRVVSAMGAAN